MEAYNPMETIVFLLMKNNHVLGKTITKRAHTLSHLGKSEGTLKNSARLQTWKEDNGWNYKIQGGFRHLIDNHTKCHKIIVGGR